MKTLGTGRATKLDEFSEKNSNGLRPPLLFSENYVENFITEMVAYMLVGMKGR